MRASGLVVITLAAAGYPAAAAARPAWTSGTYVYADLCTLPASGELAGRRVTLRRSPNGDGLVYEMVRGAALVPAQGAGLALDDATKALAFTAETEGGPVTFRGTAAADALTGTLRDAAGDHPVHLPRILRSHARQACASHLASDTTGSLGER
ncbi:hypothetical protein [Methylobacterium nigriterrae]|uniref:hypothetical protein n=1 Tax=Methylobacterium nigriterrae TaxID=3127512 RepID=UPI00301336A6